MEFNEKLQQLRRHRGLTQEELASVLFVSRAAVSKWESGRGYPSIDSLKILSAFFSVSIDALLSGDELIILAEADKDEQQTSSRATVFGLLDVCLSLVLILPVFADRSNEIIRSVPLLFLNAVWYVRLSCLLPVGLSALFGVLTLIFQKEPPRYGEMLSLGLTCAAVLAFTLTLNPYAALFSFSILLIKVVILLKRP